MNEETWRPLHVGADSAADYDALHDEVPAWLASSYWAWIQGQMTYSGGRQYRSRYWDVAKTREVERALRIEIGYYGATPSDGMAYLRSAARKAHAELAVADFLLARGAGQADQLDRLLLEGGSAWTVATRSGRPGLTRRVPEAAQQYADRASHSSGKAGRTLSRAWEAAFGIDPDPSNAYRLAVSAVEHAAIPMVVPKQQGATLGHVIGQMTADGDWGLPLSREDPAATTPVVVLGLLRALWRGHHDRHGDGDESAPDSVSQHEAEAAVGIAVVTVQWFASGLIRRARHPLVENNDT